MRRVHRGFSVTLTDSSLEKINAMLDYCQESKLSLVKYESLDVSDVSGKWDTIDTFIFNDYDDSMIFELKFL